MKLPLRFTAIILTFLAPLVGLMATATVSAAPAPVAATAANICGPTYHQTVKTPILYTQDDQLSNGNMLINWSEPLHTWCLVGTSTGYLATHTHAFFGSICLAPNGAFDGSCNSTSSKVYKQSQGLDTTYFVLKMVDKRHGFTAFNVQASNTKHISQGNIYYIYHYVQIPPSLLPPSAK